MFADRKALKITWENILWFYLPTIWQLECSGTAFTVSFTSLSWELHHGGVLGDKHKDRDKGHSEEAPCYVPWQPCSNFVRVMEGSAKVFPSGHKKLYDQSGGGGAHL